MKTALKHSHITLILLICTSIYQCSSPDQSPAIFEWKAFKKEIFKEAKEANKLVLLDIGANWCHWCHVMDDSTYSDKEVQQFLAENFLLSREDQDSRPDLFSAYRDYGWPAIIVFNEKGEELLKLKGFQSKKTFLNRLKNVLENPNPIRNELLMSHPSNFELSELKHAFLSKIDFEKGGYSTNLKSLDTKGVRFALYEMNTNDSLREWLNISIKNSYNLVDTVWGGVYQYSTYQSWNHQHFEKIMRIQSAYTSAYSLYGYNLNDTKCLEMAEQIVAYCDRFLGTETGLYYNSQNADLIPGQSSDNYYALSEKDRLAIGIPSIDENAFLGENSSMVISLYQLWLATSNPLYERKADALLTAIIRTFKTETGLYSRTAEFNGIYSFEDNRKFLDALLLSYQINGDSLYLEKAIGLGNLLIDEFKSDDGILSVSGDLVIPAKIVASDNIEAVISYYKLGYLCENERFKTFASETLSKLDQKSLSKSPKLASLLFFANQIHSAEPYHVLLISDENNPEFDFEIMQTTLLHPGNFIFQKKILGKMKPEDQKFYGGFDNGTIFLCTSSYCSSPVFSQKELSEALK